MIEHLLLGNLRFRETDYHENIERYRELVSGQNPKVLWIGCSDSRVNPERITGSGPGELFIQRNIGNIAPNHDWNFATVLEYAVRHLKVEEIVICGHSDCGAIKALDKDLKNDSYIPLWLNNAREAKARVDSRISKPATSDEARERSRNIEQENVRLQLEHLMTYPFIKKAVDEGRITVHGLYYDLATGSLSRVL
jgi:carbonic anhydrase